jgi:hypothetical protein
MMNVWIYAKSSHRESLENVRRCSAIANALEEFTPTLCTGDYRAATIARATMGVQNSMGVDAMGNLPHTMERLDLLIYDNEDVTHEMHQEMSAFCSKLYTVGKDLPYELVDASYFEPSELRLEKAIFFGDDDYAKWFVDFCKGSKKYEIPLLNGNYFFLDTQKEFEKSFCEVIEEEDYKETIAQTQYLLSASVQSCLESLAAGKKPVFFMRKDKAILNMKLILKYKIPVAHGENLDELMQNFELIREHYPQTQTIEPFDFSCLKEEIAAVLKKNEAIVPAMDYSYSYVEKK